MISSQPLHWAATSSSDLILASERARARSGWSRLVAGLAVAEQLLAALSTSASEGGGNALQTDSGELTLQHTAISLGQAGFGVPS
jgi:hypothetical protein